MATTTGEPERAPEAPTSGRRRAARRNLRWVIPLAVLVLVFLAYSLPPYLGLDPGRSRIELNADFPAHYGLLVAHILFGTVALTTGVLQVWPWFRNRFRTAHRWSGRLYVFAGVVPASIAVMGVAPISSTGFASSVGNTMLALLWLPITVAGYRMARAGRFADHRKWMLRSYALTTSIVLNRPWLVAYLLFLYPSLDTEYGGNELMLIQDAASAAVWSSWVVNLLVVEWWLQRSGKVSRRRAEAR